MSAVTEREVYHDADFETIEAAVMETARGRWFLAEHARRARAADTQRLMTALQRFERVHESGPQATVYDITRLQSAAEDVARKLDDILRCLQARPVRLRPLPAGGDVAVESEREQSFIEQRLVEPRPFFRRLW